MTLRTDLHENRWLRAQLAVLVLMAAWVPVMVVLAAGVMVSLSPTMVLAVAGCVFWVRSRRTDRVLKAARAAAEAEARALHTLRAPDAGPDQCPVCGGYGLNDLAADDAFMERGPLSKVVPYGPRRAHRDCAEFVPYVPTEADKTRDTHFREHHGIRRTMRCDWCFVEDERWEREEAQRKFKQSWPELMEPAAAGAKQIRVNRQPGSQFRHWLIHEGAPSRHMDILIPDLSTRAPDGHGWIVHLTKPLLHGLYVWDGLNGPTPRRMMPLESERLWNREAGRPYTRTELGLCDCGAPASSGKLRASLTDLFDAEMRAVDAKLRKAQVDLAWLSADLKDWRD